MIEPVDSLKEKRLIGMEQAAAETQRPAMTAALAKGTSLLYITTLYISGRST